MPLPLNILFGPRTLISLVRPFWRQAASRRHITKLFMEQGMMDRQLGELVRLDKLVSSRALAPFGKLSANSIDRARMSRGHILADWLEITVSKTIPMQEVEDQRYPGTAMPNAPAVLKDELEDLVGQVIRSVEYVCTGVLWGDANGSGGATINSTNVPGSEIVDSLDFNLPTLTSLNAWSSPATRILADEMPPIINAGESNGGIRYGMALSRKEVTSSILKNNDVTDWLVNQVGLTAGIMSQANFNAAGGIGQVPNWQEFIHGYQNDGGSFTRYVPNNQIVFLPAAEELPDYLGFVEGRIAVPRSGGDVVGAEQVASLHSHKDMGMVAFAIREAEPYSLKVIVKYRFLPVVRNRLGLLRYNPQIS